MSIFKIKDLATEISDRVNDPKQSGYDRFVGLEHYDSGNVRIIRYGDASKMQSSAKAIKKGDVLIARRNVYLKRAGIVDFDGLTSGDSIVLRAKNEVIRSILPFIFNTDKFWKYANKFSDGSMSKRLSPKILMEYEVDLPDNDEDIKRLACLLWSISDTLDSYKEMLKQCDELVKGQFVEMFGNIDFDKIGTSLIDALDVRDDLRRPLNDGDRKDMKEGVLYPYYGANGQMDAINQYIIDGDAICIAEDCGSYGPGEQTSYIIKGKSWVNNHAHVLLCKKNCNITYANNYLNMVDLRSYVSGTTRQKLTKSQLEKIKFLIPSMDLQHNFEQFYKHLDKSKFAIKEAMNNAKKIFDGILRENLC